MSFDSINAFYVLILLAVLFLISGKIKDYTHYFSEGMLQQIIVGRDQKKLNFLLLVISFIFLIIALAKPVWENKPIKLPTESLDIIVAFDISKSMMADDIYPNRLQFAKNKFINLLENIKDEKVGVIGFSASSFLVAPLTNDITTLKYLVTNLSTQYVSTQGSDLLEALKSTEQLLENTKKRALIIFTDGTDTDDFRSQINYAKEHGIKVFVYAIATQKGGVIKENEDVLKDKNGNIVVTKLNSNIKELALQSGGAYLEYSTNSNDIKLFLDVIRKQFETKKEKEVTIKDNEEYFYIPLLLAIIFYMIAISGFKRGKK
jgi:Ca-activated chloride channel family protein